jgi:hypothetical protein
MPARRFGCEMGCKAMHDYTEAKPVWANVEDSVVASAGMRQ